MNQPPDPQQKNQTKPGYEYPISGKDVGMVVVITLLILFAGFIVIAALGTMEVVGTGGEINEQQIEEWTQGNLDTLPVSLKVAAMLTQLLLIIPAWVYIKRKGLSASRYLRFRPVPPALLIYAVFIGLGVAVLGDELSRLVDMVLPLPEDMAAGIQRMMEIHTWVDFLTLGLTVILVAPVVEELLFRGFFQRFFEARRGVTSGVMMASALFAAYHFNIYWLIPILVMAVVMGAMAWRAESVLPTIVVHFTNNGLGLLAANTYGEAEPEWFVLGNHVHPLIILVAIIFTVFGLRQYFRMSEVYGLGGHGPSGERGKNVDAEA